MSNERLLRIPRALDGARLDEALATLLEGPSRALVQKWVRRGALRLGGKVVRRSNTRVRSGEEYRLRVPDEPGTASARRWSLVHEDEAILVVDKAAGVLTHSAPRANDRALCELVGETHGPLPTTFGPERPGVVHRLDRATSGLLVLARTDEAMHALKAAFAARRVTKRYLALVRGRDVPEAFECTEPLSAGRGGSDRQWVGEAPGAKPAHTRFAPLERFGSVTLLECRPTTGRRHQIRAHLWAGGLALLGESIYRVPGDLGLPDGAPRPPRQCLHAAGLAFTHPTSGRELSFESPWPDDLVPLLDALRGAASEPR